MKRIFHFGEVEGETMDSSSIDNMANVLMLLSSCSGGVVEEIGMSTSSSRSSSSSPGRVFKCKTCNRQFPSFQALGGHRASHKKPRFDGHGQVHPESEKPKVHECSICGLEFTLGQALGGHMRRHKAALAVHGALVGKKPGGKRRPVLSLDLNMPPEEEEEEKKASGGAVDCRKKIFGIELVDHQAPMVIDFLRVNLI